MVTQEGILQYLQNRGLSRTVETIATVQKMPIPKRDPQTLLHPDPVIPINNGSVEYTKEPDQTNLDPLKFATALTPLGMSSNFLDLWSNVAEGNDIKTTGANILQNVATTKEGAATVKGSPDDIADLVNQVPSLQPTNIIPSNNGSGGGSGGGLFDGFNLGDSLDLVNKAIPVILILAVVGSITRILK